MSPHPQRCETCLHYGGHICYQQHNRMSNIELTLIEMVGCASHSTHHTPAPTEAQQPDLSLTRDTKYYFDAGWEKGAKAEREQFAKGLIEYSNRMGIYNCEEAVVDYLQSLRAQQAGDQHESTAAKEE